MAPCILLIEDESSIADTIIYALKTDGFSPQWLKLGQAGIDFLQTQKADLVILDIGLPDLSGFEVCKIIRKFSEVPIIFLTARQDEVDRIVGLEIGADDYVLKPFSPRELVARVKAILKRTQPARISKHCSIPLLSSHRFEVDDTRAQIAYCQVLLELTRYEFLLLKFLIAHPHRVFSRAELMEHALDSNETSLERSIDAHIKSIRAKLRAVSSAADPIQTHRGFGYSLADDREPTKL